MNWIYPDAVPIAMSWTAYNAFLTGLMILLKRKDRSGWRYFNVSFVIFLWGVGISFMLNNSLPEIIGSRWGTFSQIVALFIPSTWLDFVVSYTDNIKKYKQWIAVTYGISIFLFLFSFGKLFVEGFRSVAGFNLYPVPGIVYKTFTAFFILSVILAFGIFLKTIKEEPQINKKNDYRWVMWASLYGFATGSLSFFPVYGISLPQYNLIIMPIWQILLTYAMTRHQAFDIEKIIQAVHRDKLAAIGTLATSINHEVRNPLYVIRGIAETQLDKESLDAIKVTEAFNRTKQQADRALDIMRRFAIFAKQNTHVMPEFKSMELYTVLENILPLIQHELDLDKVELIKKVPKNLYIQTDERHLEEILFNLIVNACQALKANGGGIIEIGAQQLNEKVEISVTDNGPGIPEALQRQIFEPFYTTKEEGTGLGLYITKQLVERNKGLITVNSDSAGGTKFTLEFEK